MIWCGYNFVPMCRGDGIAAHNVLPRGIVLHIREEMSEAFVVHLVKPSAGSSITDLCWIKATLSGNIVSYSRRNVRWRTFAFPEILYVLTPCLLRECGC